MARPTVLVVEDEFIVAFDLAETVRDEGFMLAGPFSGLPLVVCGCLKIGYDLALLRMFRHTKPPEEV